MILLYIEKLSYQYTRQDLARREEKVFPFKLITGTKILGNTFLYSCVQAPLENSEFPHKKQLD